MLRRAGIKSYSMALGGVNRWGPSTGGGLKVRHLIFCAQWAQHLIQPLLGASCSMLFTAFLNFLRSALQYCLLVQDTLKYAAVPPRPGSMSEADWRYCVGVFERRSILSGLFFPFQHIF